MENINLLRSDLVTYLTHLQADKERAEEIMNCKHNGETIKIISKYKAETLNTVIGILTELSQKSYTKGVI